MTGNVLYIIGIVFYMNGCDVDDDKEDPDDGDDG